MRVRLRTDRLQQLLATSRLSQNHWALKVGLSRGHWSDLVNGRHPYPSAKTRQAMVEAFKVPHDELFVAEPVADDLDFRAAIAARYLIDRELGSGAMGNVYLARDVARGRLVAVKTISSEASGGIGVTALAREIGVLSQLQHPNIVPVFDSGTAGECAFLVMPWIRDGSLRDLLRREGRLSLARTIELLRGVAAALDHAHQERRLHCDLKPENILLQGSHAYLADFGISRVLHSEGSRYRARGTLDTSAGTPAYVSPEQASGEEAGPASDIYIMACVAWEALAGRPPFEGTTTLEIVSRRFRGSPPDLAEVAPEIPGAVAEVLRRGMSIQPPGRPPSCRALLEELEQAAMGARRAPWSRLRSGVRRLQRGVGRQLSAIPGAEGAREHWRDLRRALRGLRRTPRFVAGTVIPLAIGLGAGGTFFGFIDHLYFRPPPGVRHAELVRRIVKETPNNDGQLTPTAGVAWVDYAMLKTERAVFEDVAAYMTRRTSIGRGEDASPIMVTEATASFFDVLGAAPLLGRFYRDGEDVRGATSAPCVISHRMWVSRHGGRPDALGSVMDIGGVRGGFNRSSKHLHPL